MIGAGFDAVLTAAQDGDEAALETLYRDLAPLVRGYLRVRGAADPDDVTSETFVAVVRNLGRFRGSETKLRSWVLTIAHRRLIDERRKHGRRRDTLHEPDVVVELAGAGADDAATGALERISDERVAGLLDLLTDDQRAVVMLRLIADLSVRDVAAILGKRPGAVKTLQRRALTRLAKVVAEGADGDEGTEEQDVPFPDGHELR
ncbi:MAG: RNA polymerase sigma factor [Actinobacteria bacterium]|nr:RNA polymerase sigma factor [Actinomycetota bacterium]